MVFSHCKALSLKCGVMHRFVWRPVETEQPSERRWWPQRGLDVHLETKGSTFWEWEQPKRGRSQRASPVEESEQASLWDFQTAQVEKSFWHQKYFSVPSSLIAASLTKYFLGTEERQRPPAQTAFPRGSCVHCKTSPGCAACEAMRESCASLVKERDLRRALLTTCSILPIESKLQECQWGPDSATSPHKGGTEGGSLGLPLLKMPEDERRV